MRVLFVDDDLEHVSLTSSVLAEVLGAEVSTVDTVEAAVEALQAGPFDLMVTDIFIPLGRSLQGALGPRARRYEETVQHLGGLVILDEIDRLAAPPRVLVHTACTDHALLEVLGSRVKGRVPKPAPAEVLLNAALEALDRPSPWSRRG